MQELPPVRLLADPSDWLAQEASRHRFGVCPVVYVAIERLATDPEFGAKLADLRPGLAHRRLGEPQLRCRHLVRPSAVAAAGAGRREARSGAFEDGGFAFELSQGGAMN